MIWNASNFARLDPKLFRGFLAVVRTNNMTEAASIASLTQGAISQQIAKLEDRLQIQLFVRSNGKVMPTAAALMLAEFAENYLNSSNAFLEKINSEFESLNGVVSYAMPESCIYSPHFPMLLERRKEFPGINLKVNLKPTREIYSDILSGQVDFGFVLDNSSNDQFDHYPFCPEEYVLVRSKDFHLPDNLSTEELMKLPYIAFPESHWYANRWMSARFGCETETCADLLHIAGSFNNLRGVVAMVKGGMGITILPSHVVASDLQEGTLIAEKNPSPIRQQIYISCLRGRRMSARVRRVIRWFLEMHQDLQSVPEIFLKDLPYCK